MHKSYREQLLAHAAASKAAHEAAEAQKAQVRSERLAPIDKRIAILLHDMPEAVKANGISLPDIQDMVLGRWRGNAHPGAVGSALRKLGWRRDRRWHGENIGFKAVWYPPHPSAQDS